MIEGPEGPWYWPLVRWIPAFQSARILGEKQAFTASCILFRRKAVESSKKGDENGRELFDSMADFFEMMIPK